MILYREMLYTCRDITSYLASFAYLMDEIVTLKTYELV